MSGQASTKYSPFYLLHGFHPFLPMDTPIRDWGADFEPLEQTIFARDHLTPQLPMDWIADSPDPQLCCNTQLQLRLPPTVSTRSPLANLRSHALGNHYVQEHAIRTPEQQDKRERVRLVAHTAADQNIKVAQRRQVRDYNRRRNISEEEAFTLSRPWEQYKPRDLVLVRVTNPQIQLKTGEERGHKKLRGIVFGPYYYVKQHSNHYGTIADDQGREWEKPYHDMIPYEKSRKVTEYQVADFPLPTAKAVALQAKWEKERAEKKSPRQPEVAASEHQDLHDQPSKRRRTSSEDEARRIDGNNEEEGDDFLLNYIEPYLDS